MNRNKPKSPILPSFIFDTNHVNFLIPITKISVIGIEVAVIGIKIAVIGIKIYVIGIKKFT
jgi:hypothetical protein